MSDPDAAEPRAEALPARPLHHRLLALLALLGLLASAGWSSWAILTDRADFGARAPTRAEAETPGDER